MIANLNRQYASLTLASKEGQGEDMNKKNQRNRFGSPVSLRSCAILLCVTLLTISCTASSKQRRAKKQLRELPIESYIDTHNHLFGRLPSRGGEEVLDYEGAARVALKKMDELSISKMLIMPPPLSFDHPYLYTGDDLLQIIRRHPDRFGYLAGGGTLNVMIQEALVAGETSPQLRHRFAETARKIADQGALGYGEMAAEHFSLAENHPYESAPPDHPLFLLLADFSAQYQLPIDIHMEAIAKDITRPFHLSAKNPPILKENIEAFERLLSHNRKAKIIWAHVGWDNTGHRNVKLIRRLLAKHQNLYMSFKVSPKDSMEESRPLARGIGLKAEWLTLLQSFPDRFLIGADQFYLSPQSPRKQIGPASAEKAHLLLSFLPPDLAHKIAVENPKRLFGLD